MSVVSMMMMMMMMMNKRMMMILWAVSHQNHLRSLQEWHDQKRRNFW